MQLATMLKGLSRNDAQQIQRDSLMMWLSIIPLFYALVMRWLLPFMADQFAERFALQDYYTLLISYLLVLTTPMLIGSVIGFLLLDERDEQTLKALMVTPMPMSTYLLYRVVASMMLSTGLLLLAVQIVGVTPVPLVPLLLVCLVASIIAPITALFFVSFAENKVQGFAMLKITGVFALVPVGAYFIPAPWQDLVGIVFPIYWPTKAFWVLGEGGAYAWWLYLVPGVVLQVVLLKLLMDRFYKQVYAAF